MGDKANNIVGQLFARVAENGWGDRIALQQGDRAWTYDRLIDTTRRVANGLRSLRVTPGERVAVMMPDCLEGAVAILGAMYCGAIAVPLSELSRPNDVREWLNDSGAAVAVVASALEPIVDEVSSETPALREVLVVGGANPGQRDFLSMVRASANTAEPAEVEPTDAAMLLYSTPIVGDDDEQAPARGIVHSHATPAASAQQFAADYLELTADDRVLSVVRLSTAYGMGMGLVFPLWCGATSMLLTEQPTSSAIVAAIDEFSPTVFFATPSVYRAMAHDATAAVASGASEILAGVRMCVSGAEGMPEKVIESVVRVLAGHLVVGYGLTEAFQFVIAMEPHGDKPGGCGRVLDGFEVDIVDDGGDSVGVGEIGTLRIRGTTVATELWNGNAVVGPDRWFSTRDRFMRDNDGVYYHCGRTDGLFKVGGRWVSPVEVERSLLGHEAVWECAVIGAEDEDGLVRPHAFVVPNVGHIADDDLKYVLREHVKSELAPYKYPRWFEFVEEIPRGPAGRVLRYKLHDRLKQSTADRLAESVAETD